VYRQALAEGDQADGGDIDLRIPKLPKGSFFPLILEPRRRIDQALCAVVMEAYVWRVHPLRPEWALQCRA